MLLATKPEQMPDLPPPSPLMAQDIPMQSASMTTTKDAYDFPGSDDIAPPPQAQGLPVQTDLQRRISEYETKTAASSAPPVQKFGDTWVATSVVGRGSGSEVDLRPLPAGGADLRDSVQRMFDHGPDTDIKAAVPVVAGPSRSDSEATARIKAWQPVTERELSIFSRTQSQRARADAGTEIVGSQVHQPDTVLSFDPNDLNPSRSASQVRRNPTVIADSAPAWRRGGNLTVVEERSDADDGMTEAMRAPPTHISHVTFPKPTVTTALNIPHRLLTPIPSVSCSSSTEHSGESTAMVTPRTAQSTLTLQTLDESVLDKLSVHSAEHTQLAKQVDGMQTGLQTAVTSLAALVATSQIMSDPTKAPVPKALEDKLSSLGLDVKGLENALQLSTLASTRQAVAEEPKLVDIHVKLDAITKTCEDILAKHQAQASVPSGAAIAGANANTSLASPPLATSLLDKSTVPSDVKPQRPQPQKRGSLNLPTDPDDEKQAGEEVAQIMTQLTGGSNKASPRLGGIQVLHNAAPGSPNTAAGATPIPEMVKEQVTEVLSLVRDLKEGRAMQTQQTTDIARCTSIPFPPSLVALSISQKV